MLEENDIDIRIMIFGNCFTGKTTFVNKWTKNIFIETYTETGMPVLASKEFLKDNKIYDVLIRDVSGQRKNLSFVHILAQNSHGCIIMPDATNKQTRKE